MPRALGLEIPATRLAGKSHVVARVSDSRIHSPNGHVSIFALLDANKLFCPSFRPRKTWLDTGIVNESLNPCLVLGRPLVRQFLSPPLLFRRP